MSTGLPPWMRITAHNNTGHSDNREHLALSDHRWWAIRRENSQNQPTNGLEMHLRTENVMTVDKSSRGEAGITRAADISGTQTRINFQFALLFLGSRLSKQLGSSKREMKAGRWTLILRRGLVWSGRNTKPRAAFDAPQRPKVRPAALDAHPQGLRAFHRLRGGEHHTQVWIYTHT